MKSSFLLVSVFLFSFSIIAFGQLDSIYHQGPSQGNVANGAMQTTDNFPTNVQIIPSQEPREINPANNEFVAEPMIEDVDQSKLPPYVYVEDTNAGKNENPNLALNGGSVLLDKFPGFGATNAVPPDPSMAVGPNHIIATVNGFPSFFRIFDKQGNILKTISVAAWYAPVSPEEGGDGQVIYDHFAGRWIINYLQANNSNQTSSNLVAYSDDDDPIGTWYVYRFDTKKHGTIQSNTWGDYPQLGFDDEAIYISTRCFQFGGYFQYSKIRVISKAELYASNGGPVTWWDFWDVRRPNVNPPSGAALDGIHPTFSYTAGQGGYFFYSHFSSANWYVLYKVLNPTSNSPRLRGRELVSTTYYTTPNAGQLGGGTPLESNGSGCRTSPIVKDGKMFIAHSTGNTANVNYASVKYVILDLNTVSILEQAELGAIGYYYIYPTIAVDESNNIAVTFTRSADSEYAGAFYSTKANGDPPGLSPSEAIQEGLGNYQQVASGRNRWGDYMAIYLDPADNHGIFTHTEYANVANSWSTYIGHLIAAPYPGAHVYPLPNSYDFGDVETGTTSPTVQIILANYGDADLTITDIPATSGNFNLETTFSPVTLGTYDSLTLEFSFSPTAEGQVSTVYPVTSNDPQFTGIELSGTGYDVTLASEKTFYASSGVQNNGDLITIDPMSGGGTTVGSSLYDEVTSISINPLDGKLYGLVTGSTSSDLVKFNAGDGDAHLLFNLNISLMAGIAFDTSGVLYGVTRSGEVYTIDITNGTTNFVVDGEGTYLGVTFNPATNELWATTRSVVVNKDLIFKVDLTSGDTTFIGNTGLDKQTNDIAFDENLDLYGIIGTSSELNDFVSIDPMTGAGTVVGSVGMKHILSLAYIDEIVLGVEDDENNVNIPTAYSLKQNYPNPFNPSTTINFSLPAESDVKLVIYNMLGQEITTLVNEQIPAGNHSVIWNANNSGGTQLTSGIYFYKLTASGTNGSKFQDVKKMILIK
ncbi:MAG: choice-of-anchor D domain-containing protein [Ignavibacteriaceae bacterium]|nr:choice-of-anchor D domain-containing protein [Ignavibacteriaceae bacterium]